MASADDLIKAIRKGSLSSVRAVLDAGAPVELSEGPGVPGMPLGIACFMGHAGIVRELIARGAKVNLPDNRDPVSPLAMAARGQHTEVIRLLIEQGAEVPADMATGLCPQERLAAEWLAYRNGKRSAAPVGASGEVEVVEEIEMPRAFGIDTTVLNADAIRALMEKEEKRLKEKQGK